MDENSLINFVDAFSNRRTKMAECFKYHVEKEFADMNLSIPHMILLKNLSSRKEPPIITDLAKEFSISPSMMTHIIDHIESAGIAERKKDPADRRSIRVVLTEKGRSIAERFESTHRKQMLAFMKQMQNDEQERFVNCMNGLMDLIEKYFVNLACKGKTAPEQNDKLKGK